MAPQAGSVMATGPACHHRNLIGHRVGSGAITLLSRALGALWLASIGIIVLLALATNLGPQVGLEVFAIRGGSMAPTIPVGAAVIAVRTTPEAVQLGDVITIRADNGVIFTHRVVEIDASEADHWFRTKGDANTTADAAPVPVTSVVGKVELSIPLLGYLIAMMTSLAGTVSFLAYAVALLFAIWGLEEAEATAADHRHFAGRSDVATA